MWTLSWVTALVFVISACADSLYVLYYRGVNRRWPTRAAAASTAYHAIMLAGVMSSFDSHANIAAYLGGAFLGTWLSVRFMPT